MRRFAISPRLRRYFERGRFSAALDRLTISTPDALRVSVVTPEGAASLIEDMSRRGFIRADLRRSLFSFIRNPDEWTWKVKRPSGAERVAGTLQDSLILSGYYASLALSLPEFYASPEVQLGSDNPDALMSAFSAYAMEQTLVPVTPHVIWRSRRMEEALEWRVYASLDGCLHLQQIDVTYNETMSPFGGLVPIQPITDGDVTSISLAPGTEAPLLEAALAHGVQLGALTPLLLQAKLRSNSAGLNQRFPVPVITGSTADRLSVFRLPKPDEGSFGVYCDQDGTFCIADDEEKEHCKVVLGIPRTEMDSVVKALFVIVSSEQSVCRTTAGTLDEIFTSLM